MINQPDIQSVFHPTFLGNRVLAKPTNRKVSSKQNANQPSNSTIDSNVDSDASSDAIVINVHLSGRKILQQFGWLLAACLWGLVFAFFLMR